MPIASHSKVAFRCRACGRLHTSGDAAEGVHPHACCVCEGGIVFRHTELAARLLEPDADIKAISAELARCNSSMKRVDSENWEVLAQASNERLAELGLSSDDVEPHEPWERGATRSVPQHLIVSAVEGSVMTDAV